MYGYDTTLEQGVTRFRFLRSLPSPTVFVQGVYGATLGGTIPQAQALGGRR